MATGSFSTTIETSVDGGTTYLTAAGVEDIVAPAKKKKAVKTSHLTSTNNYHTVMSGMKDGGEVKIKLIFDKTAFGLWDTIFESTVQYLYRITIPDGSKWVFSAEMTDLTAPTASTDDDSCLMAEATLKVSGKPVYTAGA